MAEINEYDVEVQLLGLLNSINDRLSTEINSQEFDSLHPLTKDLTITKLNAIRTLIGVLGIYLGLTAKKPTEAVAPAPDIENAPTISNIVEESEA